jgi:hypothetical protein
MLKKQWVTNTQRLKRVMKKQTKIAIGAISLLAITLYFIFKSKKGVGKIGDSQIDETLRDKMITNVNQILNPDDLPLDSGEKFSSLVKKMSDVEINTLNDFANFQKEQKLNGIKAPDSKSNKLISEMQNLQVKYNFKIIY